VSDAGDKSEEATPQRLRKAIEQGDSGASAVASQALSFLVAVLAAPAALGAVASAGAADLRSAIARAALFSSSRSSNSPAMRELAPGVPLALEWVTLVLPLLLAVALAGALAQVVQTGGAVASKRLTPDFGRLNPASGLAGLFSWTRAFAVLRALAAGLLAGWLAYGSLREHLPDLAHSTGRLGGAAALASSLPRVLAWRVAGFGLLLGLLDLLVTRSAWKRRLRMTPDEVKRERRDAEGDPHLKAARSRAHQEMLAHATIASVKDATVVVVNPTHLACALRYDSNDTAAEAAPIVVASGEGEIAERIVRVARDYGVPILRNVPLARALLELAPGEAIPEALYEAVAEILGEIGEPRPGPPTSLPAS
jgi:type III secretion protein U